MERLLEKQKTTSTPYVLVDAEKNYMKFEGRCFHEKVAEFFKEVDDFLDAYLASDFATFTFDCMIDYFNSSTSKLLFNMLQKMDSHATADKKIIVNWITTKDNEIIIECGEDFKEDMKNLEFNMVVS